MNEEYKTARNRARSKSLIFYKGLDVPSLEDLAEYINSSLTYMEYSRLHGRLSLEKAEILLRKWKRDGEI